MQQRTPRGIGRVLSFLVLPFLAVASGSTGSTQPGSQPGTPPAPAPVLGADKANAPAEYQRIWDSKPMLFDNKFLVPMNAGDPAWAPPADAAAQLEAAQPQIKDLISASKLGHADWGIARAQGWETHLPHLPKIDATTRVLFGDARRMGAAGDMDAAAERLAAIIRMARQLRSDRFVRSSRTAQSDAAVALSEIGSLARTRKLTPTAKQTLFAAVRTLEGPDPMSMKDAVVAEGHLIRDWARVAFKGPDAGKEFIRRVTPSVTDEIRATSGVEQMDEKALASSADTLAVMYQEVAANWDKPDAVAIIKSIETQKKNGDYGGLGVLIGSELQHTRVIVARFTAYVADTLKALETGK